MRTEIKISGYGGQGVITLGRMLTCCAVRSQKLAAVQTSAYGIAARGGSCWTEIVISDEDIDYPRVIKPDYLIIFSQDAALKYGKMVKDDGTILYDSSIVKELPAKKGTTLYRIPATRICREKLKSPLYANILMLGFFVALTNIMSKKDARELIKTTLPKRTIESNLKAFEYGHSLKTKPAVA